ncbi:M23 family metallopeptidase [Nonomuraea sp. NPDC050547]|uniref:M23 family metallopeptidase n=1 Tax=unclassified Nonomuraea TaxID=2593643 RepID=UPI00378ED8A3
MPTTWPKLLKSATVTALCALAVATIPQVASAQDASVLAVSHKSPFNCGKTFSANNWTPNHNPGGSIDWQNHNGDDINGETVRATAAGTAYFHDAGGVSYGKWVEIRHGDGSRTRYAHLSSMVRGAGGSMSVGQGAVIGAVGSTGGSKGPHLHYEQRTSGGAMDTSPTVEGVTVSLGQRRPVSSTNGCGGGGNPPNPTNPYTPEKACGSGYAVIDSAALTGGRTYLLYNAGNGNNCVVTMKSTSLGTASAVSAFLEPQGERRAADSGNYGYYAGPVRSNAAKQCVRWGGSVGSSAYTSPFEHCG